MGFLEDFKVGEIPEKELIPNKTEVRLALEALEVEKAKTGRMMVLATLVPVDYPAFDPIFHRVFFPMEGDKANVALRFARDVQDFCKAFGIVPENASLAGVISHLEDPLNESTITNNRPEAWALVGIDEGSDEYPEKRNKVTRWIKSGA